MKFKFSPSIVVLFGISHALADGPSAGDAALFNRLDTDKNQQIIAAETPSEYERLFARLLRRGDADGDKALSREEFLAALVPSRPEKLIEEKQPSASPQADAIRYMLLTLDASGDSWIDAEEVPEVMQPEFEVILERLDRNENGTLERYELGRGAGPLAQIAGRYVAREEIDVAAELKKLERSQGRAANRFDAQPAPLEMLSDPRKVRNFFTQLDANGDGTVEPEEAPEPFQPQLERFLRVGDRNRDGALSEREFLAGAERISRFLSRPQDGQPPDRDTNANRRRLRRPDSMPPQSMPAQNR